MPSITVDRVEELGIFSESIADSSPYSTSILLIEDTSGQGKTKLIELYNRHCSDQKLPKAHVDLKAGSLTPIDILRTIRTDIRPLELPCCGEVIQRPRALPVAVDMSDNKSVGQAHYVVNTTVQVNGLSPEERQQWWTMAAQAFFDDISALSQSNANRFILLFDTFEKASSETQNWITDQLLRMATPERMPGLFIVLAGKMLPEPSGEWAPFSQILTLRPLKVEDWFKYSEIVGSTLTKEQIQQLYIKHQSTPNKMAETIGIFSKARTNNA